MAERPTTLVARLRYEPEPTMGSRFVVTAAPVTNELEARQLLRATVAEMPDASHHCWAWRLWHPPMERAGDDGEPSGSAGRPMLSQLAGRGVTDVAVVVTRYFGGTKLGIGGLVRAYGGAVREALDSVEVIEHQVLVVVVVKCDYADDGAVERVLKTRDATVLECAYQTGVVRKVSVAEPALATLARALADATAGRASCDHGTEIPEDRYPAGESR